MILSETETTTAPIVDAKQDYKEDDTIMQHNKIRQCAISALAATISACAAVPPPTYDFDNSEVYARSFDDSWAAVIDRLTAENAGITTIEKDSGIIVVTKAFRDYGIWSNCGTAGLSILETPTATFNIRVRSITEDRTEIIINARYIAKYDSAWDGSRQTVNCTSKGAYERRILNALKSDLDE